MKLNGKSRWSASGKMLKRAEMPLVKLNGKSEKREMLMTKYPIRMALIGAVLLLGLSSIARAADKKVKVFILAVRSSSNCFFDASAIRVRSSYSEILFSVLESSSS